MSTLKNDASFNEYIQGNIRPYYKKKLEASFPDETYIPYGYCKKIIRKTYLKRHARRCLGKDVIHPSKKTLHL